MSNTDNFLAELDAEFGKKKRVTPAKPDLKALSRASFPNNAAYLGAKEEAAIANRIARDANFAELWKAEAREVWLMRQRCACCIEYTDYIAGEYIRYRNNRMHATLRRRATGTEQFLQVPKEFIHLEQDVAHCVKCLNEERLVSELWDTVQTDILQQEAETLIIPGIDEEQEIPA